MSYVNHSDTGSLIPSSCPGEVCDEDARPGVKSKASARFIEKKAKLLAWEGPGES
jgi:hypothetical protein